MKFSNRLSCLLLFGLFSGSLLAQYPVPAQQFDPFSYSSAPSQYALGVFREVKRVLGVPRQQIAISKNPYVPNAMATVFPEQIGFDQFGRPMFRPAQIILYNSAFMSQIEVSTDSRWAAIGIIAHEIGHHINNDATPDNPYTAMRHPWQKELEADYYTGKALALLGADIEDLQRAQRQMFSLWGSPSHPDTVRRIQKINEGWRDGGGSGNVQTNLEQIWADIRQQMQRW